MFVVVLLYTASHRLAKNEYVRVRSWHKEPRRAHFLPDNKISDERVIGKTKKAGTIKKMTLLSSGLGARNFWAP